MDAIVLTATVHDPVGRLAPATRRLAGSLRQIFPHIALNVSDATRPEVLAELEALGADIMTHAAGEAIIGKARRDAVAMAAGRPALYADFDHMLRWIECDPEDLSHVLAEQPEVDMLVVGRSPEALAREPQRLQQSERLVNHVHALLTGENWDLMFAIRRLSPAAADLIVRESRVDTLANDVDWPLLVRGAGMALGYAESHALFYRTVEEFGDAEDSGDDEPLQWIRRLEFAAQHAAAMRPYLRGK
ncbi:MAG: hypothetical protein NVV79_18945 [Devosia ginsengisoli]|nr:hypothetical protein [Devosia ginsengisoli]